MHSRVPWPLGCKLPRVDRAAMALIERRDGKLEGGVSGEKREETKELGHGLGGGI